MQVANDPSPDNYRNVEQVRVSIEKLLGAAGYQFADFDRILDFGCGVGRLLQALNLSRREGQELCGCDVNEACATWCRENLDFATVLHTALEPPLPYPEDSFDLVTAISVFTHLSRPLQVAWARELIRVLRPGGVAFITSCGLGLLADVLAINEHWNRRELALLGATGNFCCFAVGDESALEGQREVIALYSSDAMERIFAPLRLAFHADITTVAAGQDATVFVKPQSGCAVIVPAASSMAADDVSAEVGPAIVPAASAVPADGVSAEVGTVTVPVASSTAADGVSAEVPAGGTASDKVTHRFEMGRAGLARFRCYVAFAERRFDLVHLAVECRVKDAATARTVARGLFAFPSSVALGPNHYVPFAIDCPVTPSVDVELALLLRRDPWQPDPIRLRWWDARFEVGASTPGLGDEPRTPGGVRRADLEMARLNEPLFAASRSVPAKRSA